MTGKKISQLPDLGAAPAATDELVIVDSGVTKKVSVTNLNKHPDNVKATFGASDDLQIYHDGSNSYIDNVGTGSLIIQDTDGSGDIYIRPKSGQTAIAAYNDNTVQLAHAGNVKLSTTATGIDVTGTATLSGGTNVANRTTFGVSGFWDAVGTGNNKGLKIGGAGLYPTDGTGAALDATSDIGTSGARFKDLYLSGVAYTNGIASSDADITIANSTDGIYFGSGFFRPFSADDAVISLGASGQRFKDLYLSGGVYLGGTGAANLLDDYEAGTFTPTAIGTVTAGTATYTSQSASYEKIGDMVHFRLFMAWTSGTGTGNMTIGGLPFTSSSTVDTYESIAIGYIRDFTFSGTLTAFTDVNATTVTFRENFSNASGNIAAYDTSGRLMISGSYRAV